MGTKPARGHHTHHKLRPGWVEEEHVMRFEAVRGKQGTVRLAIHPVTYRRLFHAVAWSRLSLDPLVDLWTPDRTEAVQAVEAAFK